MVCACSREMIQECNHYDHHHYNSFYSITLNTIRTTVINSGRAHTTQHRTHCGLWLWLQSWLMLQSPHRLRNDLKCVEWDVKPCSIQSNPKRKTVKSRCPWREYVPLYSDERVLKMSRRTCSLALRVTLSMCRPCSTSLSSISFVQQVSDWEHTCRWSPATKQQSRYIKGTIKVHQWQTERRFTGSGVWFATHWYSSEKKKRNSEMWQVTYSQKSFAATDSSPSTVI